MKYILTLVCMGIAFTAAAQPVQNQNHIDQVHKFVDALSENDSEAMATFMHDNFVAYGPAYEEQYDKNAYLEFWKQTWLNFEDTEYLRQGTIAQTVTEGTNAGDWVFDWVDV